MSNKQDAAIISMNIDQFQSELRHAYVRGGPGAIVSGMVWLAAAITATYSSVANGFYLLFFAGMFIFPASKLALKLFFQRSSESKANPGGLIVLETVFPMIGGLIAAWLLLPHRPDFVFPVSAIAVGAHYFGFRTAYGDWTYWIFAAALCFVGSFAIMVGVPSSPMVPYMVAATEIVFGIGFILADRRQPYGQPVS